jgi:hypothetical protein
MGKGGFGVHGPGGPGTSALGGRLQRFYKEISEEPAAHGLYNTGHTLLVPDSAATITDLLFLDDDPLNPRLDVKQVRAYTGR